MNLRDTPTIDKITNLPFEQISASPISKEHLDNIANGKTAQKSFGDPRSDYIDYIIYDDALLGQTYSGRIDYFSQNEEGKIDLKVSRELLKHLNKGRTYYIRFNYHRQIIQPKSTLDDFYRMSRKSQADELRFNLGDKNGYKLKIDEISDSRTEIRIKPKFIGVNKFDTALSGVFFNFFSGPSSGHEFSYIAKFDQAEYSYITNWELDDVTYPDWPCSAVVKLYKPLPEDKQKGDTLWVHEEVFDPTIEKIKLQSNVEKTDGKVRIKGPDFNIQVDDQQFSDTGKETWDSLLEGKGETTNQIISEIFSSESGVNLNVDYNEFSQFVKFGSAEERVRNFIWKYRLHERYRDLISRLDPEAGSTQVEISTLRDRIDTLKSGFDNFELFLWSSSELKDTPRTDSDAFTQYMDEWLKTSKAYDRENDESLKSQLPEYIVVDERNEDFHVFIDMVGQLYDEIWLYIKHMTYNSDRSEDILNPEGLSKELTQFISESFGVKLYRGFKLENLFDVSSEKAKENKKAQQKVWRRILNSVSGLSKSKGTKRSVRALMNAYGVPKSHLSINEYIDGSSTAEDKFYKFRENNTLLDLTNSNGVNVIWPEDTKTFEISWVSNDDSSYSLLSSDLFNADVNAQGDIEIDIPNTDLEILELGEAIFNNSEVNTAQFCIDQSSLTVRFGKLGRLGPSSSDMESSLAWDVERTIEVSSEFIDQWASLELATVASNQLFLQSRHWSEKLSRNTFRSHALARSKYNPRESLLLEASADSHNGFSSDISQVSNLRKSYNEWAIAVKSGAWAKSNDVISIRDVELQGQLSAKETREEPEKSKSSPDVGIYFDPYKAVNKEIIRGLGKSDINAITSNPSKYYEKEYEELGKVRKRFLRGLNLKPDVNNYIKYVEQYNRAFFKQLKKMLPAKAKASYGVVLEPNLLEKYKEKGIEIKKEQSSEETTIEVSKTYLKQSSEYLSKKVIFNVSDRIKPHARNATVGSAKEKMSGKKVVLARRPSGVLYYKRLPPSKQKITFVDPIWDEEEYFFNNYFINHGFGSTYSGPLVEKLDENGEPMRGEDGNIILEPKNVNAVYGESRYTGNSYSELISTPFGDMKPPTRAYARYRHYTYNREFRTASKRMKYEGSVQSIATTPDGRPAVEVTRASSNRITVSPADRDKGDGSILDVQ